MLDGSQGIQSTDITGYQDLAAMYEATAAAQTIDPLVILEEEAFEAFQQAIRDIKAIRKTRVCQNALSFGKDSTLLLLASLQAHRELVAEGALPTDAPFVVSTIDTLVENGPMQMLVHEEVARLKHFCELHNINLDVKFASPPLAKTWAALFLSGHKMLSTARLNNDCSVILKIDSSERIEREIKAQYGDVTILVGSRSDESAKRAQSLKKRNQASRDVMDFLAKLSANRESNVFAPISHITTDQTWMLLRRAGTHPIVTPSTPGMTIPSYADNHLLLAVIYGDSTNETCPTTSKNVSGQGIGGCGKSSRTGCALCLKVLKDTSGEAQARLPRHSVISDNMLKVRNYMAYIAEDMSKRSWHTRAIDQTTGAIAAYPNVLNAETLDELMKLLIQCTADEYLRAKEFALRVSVGDEMLDIGYADIVNDTTLTQRERELYAEVYKRHAVKPLHKPMTEDIATYLSFIHARDGIKLPPYRAIMLWHRLYNEFIQDVENAYRFGDRKFDSLTEARDVIAKEYEDKGLRLPYPDVDVADAPQDDAPDAVMLMPTHSLNQHWYVPHTGLFSAEEVTGCMVDIEYDTIRIPKTQLSKFTSDQVDVDSEQLTLRGLRLESHTVFRDEYNYVKPKKEFSKRSITKRTTKGGKTLVASRGRTSVGSHSFSQRTEQTALTQRLCSNVKVPVLSLSPSFIPLNEANDEQIGTYTVSKIGLWNWQDYGGFEAAVERHDTFIANQRMRNESIYQWNGIHVAEDLQRYGVFDLSPKAVRSSISNLRRTHYFGHLGLFRLTDAAFIKLASSTHKGSKGDLQQFDHLQIVDIMPMPEYRSFKARQLVSIRAKRNEARRALKNRREAFHTDPLGHDLKEAESLFTHLVATAEQAIDDHKYTMNHGFERTTIRSYARYLSSMLATDAEFSRLLSSTTKRMMKVDLNAKKQIANVRVKLYDKLISMDTWQAIDVDWAKLDRPQQSLKTKPVEMTTSILW